MRHWVVPIAVWSIVALVPSLARAAEVFVRLNDGRTLRGSLIENLTSDEKLALELRASGIVMRRTLTWTQIASVQVIDPEDMRRVARQESLKATDSTPREDVTRSELPLSQLLVHAEPVSTFGKMDWDSLRLMLRGVNQRGDPVPLFGMLRVTLWDSGKNRDDSIRIALDRCISRYLAASRRSALGHGRWIPRTTASAVTSLCCCH